MSYCDPTTLIARVLHAFENTDRQLLRTAGKEGILEFLISLNCLRRESKRTLAFLNCNRRHTLPGLPQRDFGKSCHDSYCKTSVAELQGAFEKRGYVLFGAPLIYLTNLLQSPSSTGMRITREL